MLLLTPPFDDRPWPTLGPQVESLMKEALIFGPGSLKGKPYVLDADKRAILYRMYEVYPQGHRWAGRRRFKRVGYSVRKGLAKTEFAAAVAAVELHPDGPVRCDGFDAYGQPVGRPVADPYIPLLSTTVEQVEELTFGALYVMLTEGPDSDLFDCTQDRIVRLSPHGRADGKAVPLANSPGARDGARTTFQVFDEPHRLHLPRQVQAHETMVANLEKRVMEDPWGFYIGTAGELGEGSVAEGLHIEAEMSARGEISDPALFYLHREAGPGYDLTVSEERVKAIEEATGPAGEYGPGQFHSIARQWDRPKADKSYLERVWLNRWVKSGQQAYDVKRWGELARPGTIKPGSFVTGGMDGARFRDATAIVITDIETGTQELWNIWERPATLADDAEWEVPEDEVTASMELLMETMDVWKVYADPAHWTETVGAWAGRWPDRVEEWWTHTKWKMAKAVRSYAEGIVAGAVGWSAAGKLAEDFNRHIAAAGRNDLNLWDEDGQRLFVLRKIHPERRFDAAMAATLSWQAYLDALKKGARPRGRARVRRIR